eukprot:8452655-Alexandrium_andersonii.AAC.1
MGVFEEYGVLSNLKLNLATTILAPLFCPGRLEEAKGALRRSVALTGQMVTQDYAKYLGVLLGPGAGDK